MRNDRDYDDSVHAELRSSYERGRRDARRERRSSPMLLLAAAGSVIIGAVAVITLTQGTVPGAAAPADEAAAHIASQDKGVVVTMGEGDWDIR